MKGGPDQYGAPGIGKILSAEFNTSGESHYAFLFESQDGFPDYFDEKGKSLRKQLLRAPLSYSRISSSYSHRRLHPVLHTYRPHLGIDYAAPTGTPVMTTGDGTIMTASRTRANGNYIKVKHNRNYISYYLHLSKFAKGIKAGVKVLQGQVIGYVGATGIATGPHLDYRVKKNGKFVNPLRLKLPPAKPVQADKMEEYKLFASARIDRIRQIPIRDPRGEYFVEGKEPDSTDDTSTDSRLEKGHSSAID
ncbi:MAG: M23 family metallopeptidase [Bacteroidales bacterium]|nr:M23 family metallopeptidase [Candidatus Latescibacterota bacterium]